MRFGAPVVLLGAVAGLAAVACYGLMVTAGMTGLSAQAVIAAAASFGPLLLVASFGLRAAVGFRRPNPAGDLAFVFNAVAGALVTAMLLVQIGVGDAFPAERDAAMTVTVKMVDRVQLSLDMAWDVFVSWGTILFGLSMIGRAPFGPLIGIPGIAVGGALLGLNLLAFPKLPTEVGWPDLGPAVGGWYLLVSLATLTGLAFGRFRAAAD